MNENRVKKNGPSYKKTLKDVFYVWSVGITVILGGQFIGWNEGLSAGFECYMTIHSAMAIAFLFFMLCQAEISSAIAFSGGNYGLSRVVLGFYLGFLVGFYELFQYVVYSSAAILYCSEILCLICGLSREIYLLLFCAIFYVVGVGMVWIGKNGFFYANACLALFGVMVVIIFFLGSSSYFNFQKNVVDDYHNEHQADGRWFMTEIMEYSPLSTWAFGGIGSLSLTAGAVSRPKRTLPIGMILAVLTLFITSYFIIFASSSQSPGITALKDSEFPMNYGFRKIFGWPDDVSVAIVIIVQFAMGFGFFLPMGQLVQALDDSNFFPGWVMGKNPQEIHNHQKSEHDESGQQVKANRRRESTDDHHRSTVRGVIVASIVGFALCILGYIDEEIEKNLNNIAIFAEMLSNIAVLVCYYHLQRSFECVDREFRNPLGIWSCVFSGAIFMLCVTAFIGGFAEDGFMTILAIALFTIILTILYFAFIREKQTFSKAEQNCIFKLHVIKANLQKHQKTKRQKRISKYSKKKYEVSSGQSAGMLWKALYAPVELVSRSMSISITRTDQASSGQSDELQSSVHSSEHDAANYEQLFNSNNKVVISDEGEMNSSNHSNSVRSQSNQVQPQPTNSSVNSPVNDTVKSSSKLEISCHEHSVTHGTDSLFSSFSVKVKASSDWKNPFQVRSSAVVFPLASEDDTVHFEVKAKKSDVSVQYFNVSQELREELDSRRLAIEYDNNYRKERAQLSVDQSTENDLVVDEPDRYLENNVHVTNA